MAAEAFSLESLPGLRPARDWPARPDSPALHRFARAAPALFALSLPVDPGPWLARLEPGADPLRRVRAARYRRPEDALRCLAGGALLDHALGAAFRVPARDLAWGATSRSKPYPASHPHLHVSLSHAGPWVLAAAHTAELGVDVEAVRPLADPPLAQVFSPIERRAWDLLDGDEAWSHFYRTWTLKEALLKALGLGLEIPPGELHLERGQGTWRARHPGLDLGAWILEELPMPPGARAALAWLGTES